MSAIESLMQYAAGNKLAGKAWNGLVIATAPFTVTEVKEFLGTAEESFKEQTGEKHMPSAYRSAKSVILRAKGMGIAMLSGEGGVISARGKSEVEKVMREANKVERVTITPPVSFDLSSWAKEVAAMVAEKSKHLPYPNVFIDGVIKEIIKRRVAE